MTASDLERRVAELEAIVEQRTGTSDTGGETNRLSRRSLLHGIGLFGLGGYMAGSASADPQGQLGTADRPVKTVYTQRLAGGLTGQTPITSLLGTGLSIDGETLQADVADATSTGNGTNVFTGFDGSTLQFRSIEAGSNVSLSTSDGEITVDADTSGGSGESNTASNVGTGTGVFKQKSGTDLEFKSLVAGANVSLSAGTDTVTIDAASDTSPWEDPDGDDLLEPVSPYLGIDLSGVSGGQVVTPQVVSPWVGTTDATAFEAFVNGTRALRLGTQGTDLNGNTAAGNVLLSQYAQVVDGAIGAAVGGGGSPTSGHDNVVADDYGTIGGGENNQAGSSDTDPSTAAYATVAGGQNNTASGTASAVGGGFGHTASGQDATIGGGSENSVSGFRATVGGGYYNVVKAEHGTIAGGGPTDPANPGSTNNAVYDLGGTVGGGGGNQAGTDDGSGSDGYATVGGGYSNLASAQDSTIAGGSVNETAAFRAAIGGGYNNVVYDSYGTIAGGGENQAGTNDGSDNHGSATVGGGYGNLASGKDSAVSGGSYNTASGYRATVGGGNNNVVKADHGTIAGGGPSDTANAGTTSNTVFDNYGTIGGGANNQAGSDDGTSNAIYATIGGGRLNAATSRGATVGGGEENTAKGADQATVGGGYQNTANGFRATVGGGFGNTVANSEGTIAGGLSNSVVAAWASVGGGDSNSAFDDYGTVAGGQGNQVGVDDGDTTLGTHAAVPGGLNNAAKGAYSLAAGRAATADHAGAFVFGDSTSTTISSANPDEVRSQMPMYAPSFNTTSARAKKTAIEPVGPSSVLDAVCEMDVYSWEFRETDDGRHIGPMAGDFHDAFGVGDDETIATVDADGVALAAIQGLADRVDELNDELSRTEDRIDDLEATQEAREARVEELETELEAKDERIDRLEARLEDVEQALGDGE